MFVDPVMGDAGKLYKTYSEAMVVEMRELCRVADIISPNRTEAALLTRSEWKPGVLTEREIRSMCRELSALGPQRVLLTGVEPEKGRVGAAAWDAERGEFAVYSREYVPGTWYGTGDLFASVALGALLLGIGLPEAARIAVRFTHVCIERTRRAAADPRFGVAFEPELGRLTHLADYYKI